MKPRIQSLVPPSGRRAVHKDQDAKALSALFILIGIITLIAALNTLASGLPLPAEVGGGVFFLQLVLVLVRIGGLGWAILNLSAAVTDLVATGRLRRQAAAGYNSGGLSLLVYAVALALQQTLPGAPSGGSGWWVVSLDSVMLYTFIIVCLAVGRAAGKGPAKTRRVR
ncbi:hypothetical protein ACFSSC_04595 [Corynebacterium mendelii]|uniref:Uncharacterized protein n=1 Tax=Corynebacterium mendelii TaxID=2765362 RepID=A0A939E0N8_9CORY|nr:hypothetical protein [Corynebacterium mendelii]MBN9643322.1 hypothetical protein [Corynebacterium mendelii]